MNGKQVPVKFNELKYVLLHQIIKSQTFRFFKLSGSSDNSEKEVPFHVITLWSVYKIPQIVLVCLSPTLFGLESSTS